METKAEQKTLGLLGTGLFTVMQNQLWQGAMEAAQDHQARLVYYPSVGLSSSPPFDPHTKILFDLVDAAYIDGLLIWYAGIIEGVGIDQGEHFFDRYAGIPIVTVGAGPGKYPNLSIDNYQGVRSAISHLIEVHNRRKIAVVRGSTGHPDADERYQAYVDALQEYGLTPNPDWRAETLFALHHAAVNTQAAVSQWLQDPHNRPDAIVTGSDYMALAAIQAVKAHGLRVPEDIAVIGFDDVADAQASVPSVTTVRQPFYELGYQATETLLALLDGQDVPSHALIPARLIVRESCGCTAKSLSLANSHPSNHLISDLSIDLNIPIDQVKVLADILGQDISSETSQQFLALLRNFLIQALARDLNATDWQNAISALRKYVLAEDKLDFQVETLFNQARVLVTEIYQRASIQQKLVADQQIDDLSRTSEALITSFGIQPLANTLYERLPVHGFQSFYLSLYDDPHQPQMGSRLVIACENGHRCDLPLEGLHFPTCQFIPDSLPTSQLTTPIVVAPLYFSDDQLGLLVLEVGPTESTIYENLRAWVSSALQGSKLLGQIQDHATQLEQHVAERTETLTETVAQLQAEVIERQQAEESLGLTSFALEHAGDAVYWINVNYQIVGVNEVACRMLGYSREELTGGMSLQDIDPVFEASHWQESWEFLKSKNHQQMQLETVHNTKDGKQIPVEVLSNYVAFKGKELVCAFARDITQRKQTEEQAREFQEKLKALQEVSLELVATESIEKLCIKAIELGHSVLGYDRIGILLFEDTKTVSRYGIESTGELRVVHSLHYAAEDDYVLSVVLSDQKSVYVSEDAVLSNFESPAGHGWNVVTGIWDGDTPIGWMAADNYFEHKPLIPYQVELLNLYGLTIGHLVVRKRAEAEIRRLNDELEQRVADRTAELQAANARLQVLSRAKDEFVSNVSHELRTPITNMKLYQGLMSKRPDKYEYYSVILQRETHRLESLIEALLMLSRLDQDREKFLFAPVDVNEMLRQFVADRETLAATKGITLTVEVFPEPVIIEADHHLLEQVLSILLTNALAYTPIGGRVTARSIRMVSGSQRWAGFSVSDTGPGISADDQTHLFERFFRGSAGYESNVPGTGLGLSIAKEIIERHKGRIEVYSEGQPGLGTVFSVWLAEPGTVRVPGSEKD